MPAVAPRTRYKGRPRDCVIRQLNLNTESDRMLMALSGGRYSAFLSMLIAREYGRLEALGELVDRESRDA